MRLNNSRYATLLPAEDLDRMGDTLRLEVSISALCDNYDRIGSVDLVLMSRDSLTYNDCVHVKPNGGKYSGRLGDTDPSIQRIEIGRFITPFMDKNKGVDVPYSWDISFLSPLLHDKALRDTMNLWLEFHLEGVPYAANTQIAGCSGRNDVFAGTLDIVTSDTSDDKPMQRQLTLPLAYERYLNSYSKGHSDEEGTTVAHYQVHLDEAMSDAMFLMVNSNHGANSGGEEYNRRLHYVWVNEWMAMVYRPGRTSCEPFRMYNTQANGIYGSSIMTDEAWQSFSNWCPGDVIDNRIIHLGAIPAGDYDFRLMVPDAVFNDNQGYFPFSLTFFGVQEGDIDGLKAIVEESQPSSHIRWDGDRLLIDSPDKHVTEWTLLNAAGQRIMVQNGAVSEIKMSNHPTSVYILLMLMDDGTTEFHKFFQILQEMRTFFKYNIMCDAASLLRRLVLLLLLVISAENASAQLTLGYCDEEGYTSSLTNNSTTATISCAMGLTPALQADYTFCSISYLRILLTAPENLTSFKVWLRKDLNDVEDLSSIDIEPSALVEGWNDIALPDSIRLTGAETYYCGYSYRQSVKTRIPLSGTKGTDESFYVSTGGTWRDMSDRYAPICIRVGLSSNYQYAMELLDLRLDHRWFDIHSEGDTVVLRGSIRNLGSDPSKKPTLTATRPLTTAPAQVSAIPFPSNSVSRAAKTSLPPVLTSPSTSPFSNPTGRRTNATTRPVGRSTTNWAKAIPTRLSRPPTCSSRSLPAKATVMPPRARLTSATASSWRCNASPTSIPMSSSSAVTRAMVLPMPGA